MPSNCVLWEGRVNTDGYGVLQHKGKQTLAHRLAYAEANRLDVHSMGGAVQHPCDTPPCVNPKHLTMGTWASNLEDMTTKGRRAVGERHGRAKLSAEDVQYIRDNYVRGNRWKKGNIKELIARFGISREQICLIVTNKMWRQ